MFRGFGNRAHLRQWQSVSWALTDDAHGEQDRSGVGSEDKAETCTYRLQRCCSGISFMLPRIVSRWCSVAGWNVRIVRWFTASHV